MENKFFKLLILLFIFFSSLTLNCLSPEKNSTTKREILMNIPDKHLAIYESFINYNSSMDSITINNIYKVISTLEIIKSEKVLKHLIAQILLESGGNHTRNGVVVTSYAGALGICQITPITAYDYFNRVLTSSDLELITKLGGTDFKQILFDELTRTSRIELASEWLECEKNNIILWGFIMKHKLRLGLLPGLIAYNAGLGGYIQYSDSGGLLSNHEYIRGIQKRLHAIDMIFKKSV